MSGPSNTGEVNLHDWIDGLCDVLDIEVEVDEAVILDLARDAAHNVERRSAPISTFLLGYAAARSGGDPDEVERLATLAATLALGWDKAPQDAQDAQDAAEPVGAAAQQADPKADPKTEPEDEPES